MTRRNRQRKRQQRTDKSDARSKTLFKSLVENRFVQFCGALTAVVVVVQWALAQFYGPSVELGLEAVQEPFSAPFKISNQSKLFALHNVQMHCGINRVRYAGGQEAFRGFTLAYGKPFDILAGQQVEHSCYLANLRASDISTASEDIWLSYDMLWMGNRKTEPLAISWFAKGNPPRWIVGDDPMLNQQVMVNEFQKMLLDALATCADHYSCISKIYLFGSVARGDHHAGSDADVFVLYDESRDTEFTISYSNWQNASEAWAEALSQRCGHKVNIHGGHLADPPDAALGNVIAAAENPLATRGKAAIVLTVRK